MRGRIHVSGVKIRKLELGSLMEMSPHSQPENHFIYLIEPRAELTEQFMMESYKLVERLHATNFSLISTY